MAIPESPGRAAATDAFLAQGGTRLNKRGKGFVYQSGPMKGKTYDQAMQMAGDRWSSAPTEIREKYAKMGSAAMLAPSEKAAFDQQEEWEKLPYNRGAGAAGIRDPQLRPKGTFPSGPVLTAKQSADAAWGNTVPSVTAPTVSKPPLSAGFASKPPVAAPRPQPKAPVASLPPVSSGKVQNDAGYSVIAGRRKSEGYPEATREVPAVMTPREKSDAEYSVIADQRMSPAPTYAGPSVPRINRTTGLPMGYVPGDALPTGSDPAMQARASESVARQQSATASYAGPDVTPPKARIAPAPDRYADAQNQYQANGLAPKFAANMDDIYSGASSVDQAKITAGSLKRAAGIR